MTFKDAEGVETPAVADEQQSPEQDVEMKAEGEEAEATPARAAEQERRGDKLVKRKKIHFFKFWPKHLLRSAWLKYLSAGETGSNLNAAYVGIQVLDKVAQQFVLGQIKKQDRKAAKLGQRQEILDQMNKPVNGYAPKQMAAKTGRQQSTNIYALDPSLQTTNRTKKVADYSKYFQSSSDEEDDYDSEGDNRRGVSGRSQRAANRDKRKAPSQESDGDAEISGEEEEESNEEEQEEQSSESDDESQKLTRNRRRGRRAQETSRSGLRGARSGASNLNFDSGRAPRSATRGYGANQAGKRTSRRLVQVRNAGQPGDDLLQRYGFKPSDIAPVSRSERARLRNLKRGVGTDDEDLTDQLH